METKQNTKKEQSASAVDALVIKHRKDITKSEEDDYYLRRCDVCKDHDRTSVVVIYGNSACHYCGNELHLCEEHFDQLKEMISAL